MDNNNNNNINTNFENDLLNVLSDYFQNNINNSPPPPPSDNTQILIDIMHSLNRNMATYHSNMTNYLNLTNSFLNTYNLIHRDNNRQTNTNNLQGRNQRQNNSRFNRQTPFRQNRANNIRPPFSPTRPTIIPNIFNSTPGVNNFFENMFQNVMVRPTVEQINQSTETLIYNSQLELLNSSCPIRLENFQEGENIRRIISCGHCFSENSFNQWFQNNVRCPVCRYDIRDFSVDDSSGNNLNNVSINDPSFNLDRESNIVGDVFATTIQSAFDPSNNFAFRFDIPIEYTEVYDSSNNLLRREFS